MKLFNIVFGLTGILLLALTGWLFMDTSQFIDNAGTASGRVTDLLARRSDSGSSPTYAPEVAFSVDGQSYRFVSSSSSNPPAYDLGEQVEVIYDPQSPGSDARINGFMSLWLGPLIAGLMGLVFTTIALVLTLIRIRRQRMQERLMQQGQPVLATITGVTLDHSFSVNNKNPFVIKAQWQDPETGKTHIFTSAHIWFDPQPYLPDEEVSVLVDPADPEKYYMDLYFLPEKG